jgi:hypothetical protein
MKESEVEEIIDAYLKKEKAGKTFLGIRNYGVDRWQAPWEVKDSSILIGRTKDGIQIEIKGSNSNIDRTVGQCLRYHYENESLKIFIAIPEDHEKIDVMRQIFDHYNLPIGIMTIGKNREVTITRTP